MAEVARVNRLMGMGGNITGTVGADSGSVSGDDALVKACGMALVGAVVASDVVPDGAASEGGADWPAESRPAPDASNPSRSSPASLLARLRISSANRSGMVLAIKLET